MWFGVFLIIIGLVFLLENFGLVAVDTSKLFWPILLIIFGLSLIFKPKRKEK